jgi:hypothetical protein
MFGSQCVTLNTNVSHWVTSIGASDLSGNGSMHMGNAEDNQATSDARSIQQSDELLRLPTPGTDAADEQANYNATVTDGIQVDWVATETQSLATALMFNEGIANFDEQYVTMNGTGSTTITPGFQADIVIFISAGQTSQFGAADGIMNFSMYDRVNDEYASIGVVANDADTTPSSAERSDHSYMIGSVNITSGANFNHFTLGSFTSTTFDATKISSSGAMQITVVSIKLDTGYSAQVGSFAAPTSTGVTSVVSGLGFTPQLALFTGTTQTAVDTGSAASGSFFVGACDADDEFCVGGFSEDLDSATNTNTGTHHRSDSCIYGRSDAGTAISVAAFDSFPSGGIDLNFSTASTAIRVGYLAIGPDGGGVTARHSMGGGIGASIGGGIG